MGDSKTPKQIEVGDHFFKLNTKTGLRASQPEYHVPSLCDAQRAFSVNCDPSALLTQAEDRPGRRREVDRKPHLMPCWDSDHVPQAKFIVPQAILDEDTV